MLEGRLGGQEQLLAAAATFRADPVSGRGPLLRLCREFTRAHFAAFKAAAMQRHWRLDTSQLGPKDIRATWGVKKD